MGLNTQHQWYTLHNGSQAYREILVEPFRQKIKINSQIVSVKRNEKSATIYFENGYSEEFDKVIFASHADETLKMLINPTSEEQRLLSKFQYQKNIATVHTDDSIMPKTKAVWSSWNYRIEQRNGIFLPTTIYWMNRLQGVSNNKNYFVSINAIEDSIDKQKVIKEIEYHHPLFDVEAIKAQQELHLLNEKGPLYFCGSYFKYGFHEDAYASAVNLCKRL